MRLKQNSNIDPVYMDLSILVMIHFCVSACKHHIPISETNVSPYPDFDKPSVATWSTQKEIRIVCNVYTLPWYLTAPDFLRRCVLSRMMH